jgi:ribosomal-protein-alanine N-acetyltransferase
MDRSQPRVAPPALRVGRKTLLRRPTATDVEAFLGAVRASRRLHRPWLVAPETPEQFAALLARSERDDFECLFVCERSSRGIAGVVNFSQIFYGNFRSAYTGYYALAPYAGRGLMTEGLQLAVGHAFRRLGLHRVEANIQPENAASIALVRRCGFRLEGLSPRYLKIGGRWRDHERWALTVEDVAARGSEAGGRGR